MIDIKRMMTAASTPSTIPMTNPDSVVVMVGETKTRGLLATLDTPFMAVTKN